MKEFLTLSTLFLWLEGCGVKTKPDSDEISLRPRIPFREGELKAAPKAEKDESEVRKKKENSKP